MFLVEAMTTHGRLSEAFPTYEAAAARVAAIPDDELVGMAFIFQDLADGSQRLVREDGKPLQAHRPTLAADAGDALPLADEDLALGKPSEVLTPQDEPPEVVDLLGRFKRSEPAE